MSSHKTIYELDLHEMIFTGRLAITRVPGGWLYDSANGSGEQFNTTFVPYDNEYQKEVKQPQQQKLF